VLDTYELVGHIFLAQQHGLDLEDMGDHIVVVGLQKDQKVISSQVEVRVMRDGHLELAVLGGLCDGPTVMDEFSSVLEVRVHHYAHKVILHDAVEGHIEFIFTGVNNAFFLDIFEFLLKFVLVVVGLESVVEGLVAVSHREEGNGALVVHKLQEVFVVLNSLLGKLVVHGS